MFLAIQVHCTPPDTEAALGQMRENIVARIRDIDGMAEVGFGIQLDADNSSHKLGDTIWADVEVRGAGSRELPWSTLNAINNTLLILMFDLATDHINQSDRLADKNLVPCELVESNTKVQGVGHWAEGQLEPIAAAGPARQLLEGLQKRIDDRRNS